ncbi:hypothetical protein Bpfe_002013 [Biomphalaria pfeifferi]|uniref:Uncharacterized protein n=1 Tax=Biomphalaria pfeifferi TaxID=112525 RepID=A0AAD8C960_BIOPF|nr:hypothetical protein Bpfe_002013 [Biomphalaria pfeifferi]
MIRSRSSPRVADTRPVPRTGGPPSCSNIIVQGHEPREVEVAIFEIHSTCHMSASCCIVSLVFISSAVWCLRTFGWNSMRWRRSEKRV